MASNISKFSTATLPFVGKWVSWSENTPAPVLLSSRLKLGSLDLRLAAFVDMIIRLVSLLQCFPRFTMFLDFSDFLICSGIFLCVSSSPGYLLTCRNPHVQRHN